MTDIKPIETRYKGHRFRSRLEARWAVFFDNAGIEWEYEPEGFELPDGTRYLPDFYLPSMNFYAEIKPYREGAYEELKKVFKFVKTRVIDAIIILPNIPNPEIGPPSFPVAYYEVFEKDAYMAYLSFEGSPMAKRRYEVTDYEGRSAENWLGECFGGAEHFGAYYAESMFARTDYTSYPEDLWIESTIYESYIAARSARFEFGEEG